MFYEFPMPAPNQRQAIAIREIAKLAAFHTEKGSRLWVTLRYGKEFFYDYDDFGGASDEMTKVMEAIKTFNEL